MHDELTCRGRAGSLHRLYIITVVINEVKSIYVCRDIGELSLGFLLSFFCLYMFRFYFKPFQVSLFSRKQT